MAEKIDQGMILLKLDFNKAYNIVFLPFLFQTMVKMEIQRVSIDMVKLLFQDVQVVVLNLPSPFGSLGAYTKGACLSYIYL